MENPSYYIAETRDAVKRAEENARDKAVTESPWQFCRDEETDPKPLFSVKRAEDDTRDAGAAYDLFWGQQPSDTGDTSPEDPAPVLVAKGISPESVIVACAVGKFVFDRCGFPVAPEKTAGGETLAEVCEDRNKLREALKALREKLSSIAESLDAAKDHAENAASYADDAKSNADDAADEAGEAQEEADTARQTAAEAMEELKALSF